MKRHGLAGAAVAALATMLLPAGGADAAMHATDEFRSGETRPVSIAFLPPHVDLVKRRIIQSEARIDEAAMLADYLAADLERLFAARGYDVRVLTPEEVNADPELRDLVLDADRRYAEMLGQVQTRLPRQIAWRRYQAGDEMRVLAGKLGVDAIGFAHLQIVAAAAGASAVAIIAGVGQSGSSTMMSVSLIDGASAYIEAFFVPPLMRRGSMFGYDSIMEDPKGKVGQMAEVTLRDLPEVAGQAQSPKGQEDVISDIETLLEQ